MLWLLFDGVQVGLEEGGDCGDVGFLQQIEVGGGDGMYGQITGDEFVPAFAAFVCVLALEEDGRAGLRGGLVGEQGTAVYPLNVQIPPMGWYRQA